MPVRRPSRANGDRRKRLPDCKDYKAEALPPLLVKLYWRDEPERIIEFRDPREAFLRAYNVLGVMVERRGEPVS